MKKLYLLPLFFLTPLAIYLLLHSPLLKFLWWPYPTAYRYSFSIYSPEKLKDANIFLHISGLNISCDNITFATATRQVPFYTIYCNDKEALFVLRVDVPTIVYLYPYRSLHVPKEVFYRYIPGYSIDNSWITHTSIYSTSCREGKSLDLRVWEFEGFNDGCIEYGSCSVITIPGMPEKPGKYRYYILLSTYIIDTVLKPAYDDIEQMYVFPYDWSPSYRYKNHIGFLGACPVRYNGTVYYMEDKCSGKGGAANFIYMSHPVSYFKSGKLSIVMDVSDGDSLTLFRINYIAILSVPEEYSTKFLGIERKTF